MSGSSQWQYDYSSGRYYYRDAQGNVHWQQSSSTSPTLTRSVTTPSTQYSATSYGPISYASGGAAAAPQYSAAGPSAAQSPGASSEQGLDPSYQIRTDARTFFIRGRMFSMLHVEAFGGTAADVGSENVYAVKYGEKVFCQIRRFVVVKDDKGFCLACPVATYRGRGTTKPGVNPKQHAVIFTTNSGPTWMPGETGMDKDPIGVDPADPSIRLGPASRINFAQVHCIQQNVKVKDMGLVRLDDLPKLIQYYRSETM